MAAPKKTEAALLQKLRQSEARLKEAVRAGNVGLWDWDLRTNRVYYSPEWKRQIGYEDHEISDQFAEWQRRVHPDDLVESLQAVQEFLTGARPSYSVEFRFRHKDGSYRWILAQGSLYCDERGRPERMLGSHVDITAQKNAAEASRTQIQGIHECLVDGLVMADAQTRRIIQVNQAMCRLFGYPAEAFAGKASEEMHPPESRAWVMKHFSAMVEGGERRVQDVPCVTADGRLFFADISAQPIEFGGRQFLIGVFRDVTERKRAEEALRESQRLLQAITNNLPGGMLYQIVRERDGRRRFTYVSEAVTRLHGCTVGEALADAGRVYSTVVEDGRERLAIEEEQACSTLSVFRSEVRIMRPTGEIGWSLFASSPRLMEDGATCWDGVEIDIWGIPLTQPIPTNGKNGDNYEASMYVRGVDV